MQRDAITSRLAGLSPAKRALLERRRRGEGAALHADVLGRRETQGPAPLSFSQQRLWFLDQLDPGTPAYNLRILLQLEGPLDRAALARSLAEVMRRHEVLRSALTAEATAATAIGAPVQVVLPHLDLPLPLADLTALAALRRQAEVERQARAAASRGFDLSRPPLVRTILFAHGAAEHHLAVVMHHVVSDGWSFGVMLRELIALYGAFSRRLPSPLAALPLQYADFAVWQRRQLAGGALADEREFWRRQLAGAPPFCELPTDRPYGPRASARGASRSFALAAAAAGAVAVLARREAATPFMIVLAAFQALLLRYTGEEDVVVGSPVAGRNRPEVAGLIGFFVNTLALRGDLSGDPDFVTLVARVRHTVLAAFAHQELPFERLVEELQPARDPGRNPIFQVMLAFQQAPVPEVLAPGLALRQVELASDSAMFEISFNLRQRPDGLTGTVEYAIDLFDAATAGRWATHLVRLIEAGVADPSRRLSEIPLLSAAEGRELLLLNETAAPYRDDVCLHQLFAAQAAARPDAPAVVFQDCVLTYGELAARAGLLARHLQRRGVGPEVPVGLCVARSLDLAVGILGILQAGGAYVPLDPSHPPERLAMILDDARCAVVLTQAALAARLGRPRSAVLRLDADWAAIAHPDAAPHGAAAPAAVPAAVADNLAYIIYTSGSTGSPKGVACTHRGVVNMMADLDRRRPLGAGEACGVWTGASFDVAVWEIFSALGYGGALHIPADSERTTADGLCRWLERYRIRSLYLPGFLLADYASWVGAGPASRRLLGRLLVGVEPIAERLLASLRAAVPGLVVVNGYGPTEATVCATFYDVGTGPVPEGRTPIGLPVANCRVHLLDAHLARVAPGLPGEIAIGGPGLARGYHGDPARTAASFVPDPFGAAAGDPGARLYRTGDRARRRADGNLLFLGRRDAQVKVRGMRIELGEIEEALGQHPGVRETVAVVKQDPSGEKQLVAYVVARAESAGDTPGTPGTPGIAGWREFLFRRLPAPMLPAALVVVAALPLTAGGKVNRRALPEPDWSGAAERQGYVAPRNPIEALLAGIWSELLGREAVSVEDDFLEIGGHSLLAARVVSRVRQVFDVELPLRTLFETRTVRGLAARVEALLAAPPAAAAAPVAPPLAAAPRGAAAPLSFAQRRLWFFAQLERGSALFNMPGAVRLTGRLEREPLRRALDEIVRRHEVLRTTFATAGGQPVQVIAAARRQALPVVDLGGLPAPERAAEARRRAAAEARLPFDLAAGPLLRTTLLRLGQADHLALLTFHHTVADGWSLAVFLRELGILVSGWPAGQPSPLPELPVQYADFAIWQRRWLQGDRLANEVRYWRQELAGIPPLLPLPTDRPRPAEQSFRGGTRQVAFGPELVAPIAAWAQRQGGTLFMALLGALAVLLGRIAGRDDVVVGSPIAGRDRQEIEGSIGLFVNTLVLRVDLAQDPAADPLLVRIRRTALGAYTHSHLPFEQLVDEISPARSASYSPLHQVSFALQNVPAVPPRLPGLAMEPLAVDSGTAKVDLALSLTETAGALAGSLEWSTDLFDRTTVDRWVGHLAALVAALPAAPATPLSALPLLTAGERHQLVHEWNDTAAVRLAAGAPPGRCVHELFEEQADRTPGALAASVGAAGGGSPGEVDGLTYGELNRHADRLARLLMARGVGPEVVVGLCLDRSPRLLTAILAIWKAGGAYLPLDPSHPRERLAVLAGEVSLVVTESRWRERLPETAQAIDLDALPPDAAGLAGRRPGPRAAAANLAYVLHTSGSTGAPKGIMVSHAGLAHYLTWAVEAYEVRQGTGAPVCSPFGFDLTVTSLLAPLLAGRCVELWPLGDDFEVLRRVLAGAADYSLLKLTPAHLELLRQDPASWPLAARVRVLIVGGDALQGESLDLWRSRSPATRVINEYGPTETVVGCCVHEVPAGAARGTVSIGRPIPNMRAHVLDAHLQPLPVGVPGELYLAGSGLARGYRGLPHLTAEKLLPDLFAAVPGGRLYRTGDLVRVLPDGRLDFLGRIDHQVKVRGFRIELGEIESVLASHPAVRAAAVVAPANAAGQRRLVAFWTPHGETAGGAPDAHDLRTFLAGRLPDYMVPAVLIAVAELPQTPNAKIDRRALLATAAAAAAVEPAAAAAAPRAPSAAEETLIAIWSAVLERRNVGLFDNFFALGGDSILSLQVVARARQAGLLLRNRDVFQHQTVAQLAAVAVAAPAGADLADEAPEGALTPIQAWFFALELADPHHFNQALLLDVLPAVEPSCLRRALDRVVGHHPALPGRFERDPLAGWRQVAAHPGAPVAGLDLSALPAARRGAALEAAAAQLQGSLDLTQGPLFRLALFALGETGRRLLLVFHHLVIDAVSWRILLSDLEVAYRALAGGREPHLPPVPTSQRRWAAKLAEHARSAAVAADLDYWLDSARAAVRPLPRDRQMAADRVGEAATVVVELDAESTLVLLEKLPATHHVGIHDALLTALAQAFAGWQREPRLLVDLEGHGREELFADLDLSRTVGWFTNLYPVLLQLGGKARRPVDHLRSIKEQLRAVPQGGMSYGLLRYQGTPEQAAQLRRLPPAEVVFNYLGQLDRGLPESRLFALAGESGGPARSPRQRRAHTLEINGGVLSGRLRLTWTYSTGAHDRATVEALAESFRGALRALVEQGDREESASFTPSDFPQAKLGQKDLDMLVARIGKRQADSRAGRPKAS